MSRVAEDARKRPWRDSDVLHELYHNQGMTCAEIADELGCEVSTVWRNIQKNDIKMLRVGDGKHDDPEWLHEKYHEEGLTMEEMGELIGKGTTAIRKKMLKYGIERREAAEYFRKSGRLRTRNSGHPTVRFSVDGSTHYYDVHRMLAIAEFGLDAVSGKVIHHRNGVPWDNRPENLELLDSQSEHAKLHTEERRRDSMGRFR